MQDMTDEEIAAKVIAIISEQSLSYGCPVSPVSGGEPPQITMETRLAEDLEFDSLDCVEALMALEDAFDIYITEDDAGDIRTVGDVVRAVKGAYPASEFRR